MVAFDIGKIGEAFEDLQVIINRRAYQRLKTPSTNMKCQQ